MAVSVQLQSIMNLRERAVDLVQRHSVAFFELEFAKSKAFQQMFEALEKAAFCEIATRVLVSQAV
jgi:hypothetical protein